MGLLVPEVIAMKNWKTERSGYLSPIVAETDGNHSSGYPFETKSVEIESIRRRGVSHNAHSSQFCGNAIFYHYGKLELSV